MVVAPLLCLSVLLVDIWPSPVPTVSSLFDIDVI